MLWHRYFDPMPKYQVCRATSVWSRQWPTPCDEHAYCDPGQRCTWSCSTRSGTVWHYAINDRKATYWRAIELLKVAVARVHTHALRQPPTKAPICPVPTSMTMPVTSRVENLHNVKKVTWYSVASVGAVVLSLVYVAICVYIVSQEAQNSTPYVISCSVFVWLCAIFLLGNAMWTLMQTREHEDASQQCWVHYRPNT